MTQRLAAALRRQARCILVASAAQSLLGAMLCTVPLFDVLGYEFCWAMGLLTAVTAPWASFVAARGRGCRPHAVADAFVAALTPTLPPLVLALINMVRVQNCNLTAGFGFWCLLPLATAIYGAALGLMASCCGRGRRAICALTALVIAPLMCRLYALWAQPAICAFDHLWGYFAGSLYDEAIGIDVRLVGFRAATLLRAAALSRGAVYLSDAWRQTDAPGPRQFFGHAIYLVLLIFVPITFEALLGPRLGFAHSRHDIEQHLSVVVRRAGVVVRLPAGTDTARAARIADDHAFRLQTTMAALGVAELPEITSYVFSDADDKATFMGGRQTMVAKPWLREIYLHDVAVPHPLLAHEMGHAVAAAFGSWGLGLSARYGILVNMGIVEGLAQAFTPPHDALDVHATARALDDMGLMPDMSALMQASGFWLQPPARAYAAAGSFLRWLIDTHGILALHVLYPQGDFRAAYGQPLHALVASWRRYLATLTLSPAERRAAEAVLAPPSIFWRTCAHEVARQTEAAHHGSPAERLARRRQVAAWSRHAPAAELEVARALLDGDDLPGFFALQAQLLGRPGLTAPQREALGQASVQAHWLAGARHAARQNVEAIVADPAQSAAGLRLALAQQWAMQLAPEVGGRNDVAGAGDAADDLVMWTLNRRVPLCAATRLATRHAQVPTDRTAPYLLGRLLLGAGVDHLGIAILQAAGPHPQAAIEDERLRLLGTALAGVDRHAEAAQAWQQLTDLGQSAGLRARARDGLMRARWSLSRRGESGAPDGGAGAADAGG